LEDELLASTRVIKEERANCGGRHKRGCIWHLYVNDFYSNTSTDKGWILDSGSVVHVCSQKEMFKLLVAKEEGTVKMVDDSACKC